MESVQQIGSLRDYSVLKASMMTLLTSRASNTVDKSSSLGMVNYSRGATWVLEHARSGVASLPVTGTR